MSDSKFQSKEMVKVFFKAKEGAEHQWICMCGTQRKQNLKSGYKNLIDHILTSHSGWKDIMKQTTSGTKITSFIGNNKAVKIYSWLSWIVSSNLPFTFVENDETRMFVFCLALGSQKLRKFLQIH